MRMLKIAHRPKAKEKAFAVAVVIAVWLLTQMVAVCGTAQEAKMSGDPAFEVVSVKSAGPVRSIPHPDGRSYGSTRPFRYTDRTVTANQALIYIVAQAYSVESWEIEGPGLMDSLTYDISATMPPNTSKETARLMLRTMLAERFGFKFHREKREIPVYALVEAKSGFKLHEATDPGPRYINMGGGSFIGTGTLDHIAGAFPNFADRPILNMTGIKGTYHVEFHWTPDYSVDFQRQYSPEFWAAVQREVGLKLEKRNVLRDVMVIDHVEREPAPN